MVALTIRLPDDLHATLKSTAKSNRRSLHGEILARLEGAATVQVAAGEGKRSYAPDPKVKR